MADKIDMEYTIGNHVEFIRTDNDAVAVIVKLDTALAFERQQVQDVAKLAEYYRALTQVAREERDAAQRANGILAQNAIDAADYGKRNFVMAIEQTKKTMRALSLFRAANAAKRKMRKERDQLREWQERASTRQRINDRCPACGHMTLFVSDAGYLTCSFLGCKEPGVMRAVKMIEAERDAAIAKLAEYEGDNKRWHSFETVQAIVKERDAQLGQGERYY